MYIVDITRNKETDILCGNNSMDTKNKIINYVYDYVLANYNYHIDKQILDKDLDIKIFSLKDFLINNYSITIDEDLVIQTIYTNKDNCIILKYMDDKTTTPILFNFNKNDLNKAYSYMQFLINDSLIDQLQNNLQIYDDIKLVNNKCTNKFNKYNINSEITSLYKNGIFLDELLNSNLSLNQLNNKLSTITI